MVNFDKVKVTSLVLDAFCLATVRLARLMLRFSNVRENCLGDSTGCYMSSVPAASENEINPREIEFYFLYGYNEVLDNTVRKRKLYETIPKWSYRRKQIKLVILYSCKIACVHPTGSNCNEVGSASLATKKKLETGIYTTCEGFRSAFFRSLIHSQTN